MLTQMLQIQNWSMQHLLFLLYGSDITSQWSSGNMPDCSGPRFKSHCGHCLHHDSHYSSNH